MTDRCEGIHCERFARKGEELCDRCAEVFRVNIPKRDFPGEIWASLRLPATWKFESDDEMVLRYLLRKVMDRAMDMAKEKGMVGILTPEPFTSIFNDISAHDLVYGQ